jgi:hemerythrin
MRGGSMSRIEWDEALSVQNDEIDGQHKKWIEIHNRLHEVLISGNMSNIDKIGVETLQAILEYARYHFKFEEDYLKRIDYPGLVEHRRLHKDFDTRAYASYREILAGQVVLNSEILKVMKNWLLEHILHEDQKYRRFLQGAPSGQ